MKTIFTLLLSTLFSLSLFAYDGTRLTVSSVSSTRFRVEVDGRRYNMDDKTISIRDLSAGYHTVKIFNDKKKNKGWFNNRQNMVYSQSVYLKQGYDMDITINRFGKAFVDEQRMDQYSDWNNDDNYNDRDDRGNNRGNDPDNRWDNSNSNNNNYNRAMNGQEFNQVKESLRREWFENSRVSSAKLIFDRNYFSAQQVKEVLELFSFENNKLELAKYAYGHTVDKNSYYIINDVFAFSSSKAELNNYIRDFR